MGLTVHSGDGGFYHWLELPEGMDSDEFNNRLFKRGAAILKALTLTVTLTLTLTLNWGPNHSDDQHSASHTLCPTPQPHASHTV